MPTIGPYYPSSQAQDASNGGTKDWNLTGNATADDGNPADCTFDVSSFSKAKLLVVTGFGITTGDLPEGAIIDEVTIEIEHRADYYEFGGTTTYVAVCQAKFWDGGSLSNFASQGSPNTVETVVGPQQMVTETGYTPSSAAMRGSTFGFAIEYENFDDSGTNTNRVYVDFVRIAAITYHLASGKSDLTLLGIGG